MSPQATLIAIDSTYGLDPVGNIVTSGPSSPAAAKRGRRRRRSRTPRGILSRLRCWLWEQRAPLAELVAGSGSSRRRLVAALGPKYLKVMVEGGQKVRPV